MDSSCYQTCENMLQEKKKSFFGTPRRIPNILITLDVLAPKNQMFPTMFLVIKAKKQNTTWPVNKQNMTNDQNSYFQVKYLIKILNLFV